MYCLQKSVGDKEKTGDSVLIRRGNFIYNTWSWQGVSSSASILQGWSARLRIYCTVFGNQDWSGTINTRLKQQILPFFCFLFLSIFFLFSYKMVQTTIQNICAVDNLQKKSFDSITVQLFFSAFFSLPFDVSMVHQNPFWTAASVKRAATHFKMLYGYWNRTHMSIVKRHAKSSNCTGTACLTWSVQLQANTTLCTLELEQCLANSCETLLLVFFSPGHSRAQNWLLLEPPFMCVSMVRERPDWDQASINSLNNKEAEEPLAGVDYNSVIVLPCFFFPSSFSNSLPSLLWREHWIDRRTNT